MTPNMMKTMANSPAVLEGYLGFSGALGHGALAPKLREQLALVVSEDNGCGIAPTATNIGSSTMTV
jgi:alkylhydroperoxidase family enzyme